MGPRCRERAPSTTSITTEVQCSKIPPIRSPRRRLRAAYMGARRTAAAFDVALRHRRNVRIHEYGNHTCRRNHFVQKSSSFGTSWLPKNVIPVTLPPGRLRTRDKSGRDLIGSSREYDRNRLGRRNHGAHTDDATAGYDDCDLAADEVGCHCRAADQIDLQPSEIPLGPARFVYGDVVQFCEGALVCSCAVGLNKAHTIGFYVCGNLGYSWRRWDSNTRGTNVKVAFSYCSRFDNVLPHVVAIMPLWDTIVADRFRTDPRRLCTFRPGR